MREHRPKNHHLIEIVYRFVDLNRHIHFKASAGEFLNRAGGDGAEIAHGIRVVPLVIVKRDVCILLAAFFDRDFQPLTNGFLAHRVMCAECDHHIEL